MAVGHAQRTPRHSAFESRKIGYVIKWRDRQSPEMHLRVGNKSKCPLAAYSSAIFPTIWAISLCAISLYDFVT